LMLSWSESVCTTLCLFHVQRKGAPKCTVYTRGLLPDNISGQVQLCSQLETHFGFRADELPKLAPCLYIAYS